VVVCHARSEAGSRGLTRQLMTSGEFMISLELSTASIICPPSCPITLLNHSPQVPDSEVPACGTLNGPQTDDFGHLEGVSSAQKVILVSPYACVQISLLPPNFIRARYHLQSPALLRRLARLEHPTSDGNQRKDSSRYAEIPIKLTRMRTQAERIGLVALLHPHLLTSTYAWPLLKNSSAARSVA
jgi:hypothetical protein